MRIRKQLSTWSLFALFIAGLAMACGGGEEATPTPTPQPAVRTPTVAPTPTRAPTPTVAGQPTATPVVAATPTPRPTAAPTAQPPQEARGTLKVAIASFSQESFDPAAISSGFQEMATQIYDWMIWQTLEGELAPGVLTAWAMAADGKSWTLTVRSGMRFHDGAAVTPEDVKLSLDWSILPRATYSGAGLWRRLVDRAEVVSSTGVRLFTKETGPLVQFSLAPRSRQFSGIVLSKAAMTRMGEKAYFEAPVGSGPWKFERHERTSRIVYRASEVKHPFRATPGFAQLEMVAVPEESTRVAALRTGQAHLAEVNTISVALLKQAGQQVFEIPGTTIASSMIPGKNNPKLWSQSPISNLKVREAMLLALNRQEIADTIMGGFAVVAARHAIDPSGEGYDPAWKPEPFDPQQAKQLLIEAGYPNGFDLRAHVFPYSGAAWFVPIMEAMAGYWTNIGIPVRLIPNELGTISRLYGQRPQGPDIVGTTFLLPSFVRQQPLSGLEAVYASTSRVNLLPAPDVMDDLLFRAQTTLDSSERVRLTKEIVNLAHGERLALPIVTAGALYGAAKDLDGWRPIQGLSMIGTILENLKPKR